MYQQKIFTISASRFGRIFLRRSFLLIILLTAQSFYSQNSPEITSLELNKPLEREIMGGQKHIYQIAFPAAQYAKLIIAQRGIDVAARLLDAADTVAIEYDFDPRNNGDEPIEMTVKSAGNYQLTVEPRQRNAAKGRYEIRLVEMRNATEKEFAVDETRKLITQANRLWRAGKYDEALPLAERALAVLETESGAENYDVSQALFVLANIWSDKGDYAKAETFYQRAFEIREKVMGKDHISLSQILNNLGVLYKDKGEYEKAELLFQRVLEIREKALEPNHLLIASVLVNLGIISKAKGDVNKAAAFYRRALEIREKALGTENAEVALMLNNIANLYSDISIAEPLYLRALGIREKIFGPEHHEVAQTLYNLAVLYGQNGNFTKSLPLAERALKIWEKTLGAEHPFTSLPLNLMGIIYKNTGDYAKSELFYLRSIAIKEKTQSRNHQELAGVLSNLANLYALRGDVDKAIALQTRANEIIEYNIKLNLAIGSEREKLGYLQLLSRIEDQTLSLNIRTASNFSAAANLAVTAILQRKGRVLDALSDNYAALRRRFNSQDQLLLDKLNDTTTRLSKLVLEGLPDISAEEYQEKINQLEQERENLEAEISRRSAGFYQQTKPITLEAVRAAIPENAALIEIAVYRPVSPKESELLPEKSVDSDAIGKPRYVAYIIRKTGEVKFKDLGETAPIDENIKLFRQALRDSKSQNIQTVGRDLEKKIITPLRTFLGDAAQLLISADGNLNLIPFEALTDANSRYLIENYSITYLTSGRDLLRLQVSRESKNQPMIIANPLFGEAETTTIAGSRNKNEFFAPLGGTLQEARAILTLYPNATFLNGGQATETALKQTNAPQILHLATHGFFLEDKTANTKIENPLLRSGLALAGANRRTGEKDDGIFTALEASGLNLWGTKLVVLSACDTGLGEVRHGEGVFGLRRAFILAGTESLVMSLWAVSDYATRELMTNYYRNLRQGLGRGEALRQVQLEMLKKPNRQHPFFWASFIQSGDWTGLESKK